MMAAYQFPYFTSGASTVAILRDMLETCETKADMDAWSADFMAHSHFFSFNERVALAAESCPRLFNILLEEENKRLGGRA